MASQQKQIVSSLMDDQELASGSVDQLVKDNEMHVIWSRYHMIRDVMQDDGGTMHLDISTRISSSLADEPAILAPRNIKSTKSRFWHHAGGLAVAASVAVVALVGVQMNDSTDMTGPAPGNLVSTPLPQELDVSDLAKQLDPAERLELQRINDLFLAHTAKSASLGVNGSLPYVRVVSGERRIPVNLAELERLQKLEQERKQQLKLQQKEDQPEDP